MNEVVDSTEIKITFFMIVTNRDIYIADACVRRFKSVYKKYFKKMPFKLLIYANGLSNKLKKDYLSNWGKNPFVNIKISDDFGNLKPGEYIENFDGTAKKLIEGPYKPGALIWDCELPQLITPYFCTVDADFEIYKPDFLKVMFDTLESNQQLAGIASDYTPTQPYFDTYSNSTIMFHERWNTWCCMYRKEVCLCKKSHFGRKVKFDDEEHSFDDAAYFQMCVQEELSLKFSVIDSKWQKDFIHYGAFSKNRDLKGSFQTLIYRYLSRLKKNGLDGSANSLLKYPNWLTKKIAAVLFCFIFSQSVQNRLVWDFTVNKLDKV